MKVLIIQQKMIGDVLTSTILCQLIKEKIPGSVVHFLINTHTAAVVDNNPFIDEMVYFTEQYRKSKYAFYQFLKSIRNQKYDVVIDVYCKLESNLISLFSRADKRISYRKWYSKFIYTHLFNYSKNPDTKVGLAIENRLLLLKPLLSEQKDVGVKPKVYLKDREIVEAKTFLESKGISFEIPLIMIGVLGSGKNKTYPLAYMASLIDSMVKAHPMTLLFNYIPSQQNEAEALYSQCSEESHKHIKFDIFSNSLRSFLAVLHHCDALVSNEGGAVNMAKALNVPTFSIYAPWISKMAWDTYRGDKDVTVHLKDYQPLLFEGKTRKELKKETPQLYRQFKPSLFKDKLDVFLERLLAH